MYGMRRTKITLLALAVSLTLAACASPPASPPASPTPRPELPTGPDATWDVVVIGDSSMWELADALVDQVEEDVGVKAVPHDYALGGLSAGQVLQALESEEPPERLRLSSLRQDLEGAAVVVMFTNPEDSNNPENPMDFGQCFAAQEPRRCPPESFEKYRADLEAIWEHALELRAGQPVILFATDLYVPLVPRWKEKGVFEACTACWETFSDAIRLAAEAHDIPFISRYDVFNGPNHDEDPDGKGYLSYDGIHPTELAAEVTADLLSEVGYEPVTPP
jgi:hypothetical protein